MSELRPGPNVRPSAALMHKAIERCVVPKLKTLAYHMINGLYEDYPTLVPSWMFVSRFGLVLHFGSAYDHEQDSDVSVVFGSTVGIHRNHDLKHSTPIVQISEMPVEEAFTHLLYHLTAVDLI